MSAVEMSANDPIRLIIADDDPIVREALRGILARESWIEIVGEVSDGLEAVGLTVQLLPDILLLDILMPKLQGIGVLRELSSLQREVGIILVCSFITAREVVQALQFGARGILRKKSITSLAACIQAVTANRYFIDGKLAESPEEVIRDFVGPAVESNRYGLTRRELQIVSLVYIGQHEP